MVEMGLRRGFKNNGLVDIDLESDEGESEVEKEMAGVIYRVPELGIKLDFIDRIRRQVVPRASFVGISKANVLQ